MANLITSSLLNGIGPGALASLGNSTAKPISEITDKGVNRGKNSQIIGKYIKTRLKKVIGEDDIVNAFIDGHESHFNNDGMKDKVVETYNHILKIFAGVRVSNNEETFKRMLFDLTVAKIPFLGVDSLDTKIISMQTNIMKKIRLVISNMRGGELRGKQMFKTGKDGIMNRAFKSIIPGENSVDPFESLKTKATNSLMPQPSNETELSPALKCFVNKNTENIIESYIKNETDAKIVNDSIQLSMIELIYDAFNRDDMRNKLCNQVYKHVDEHIRMIATKIVESLCAPPPKQAVQDLTLNGSKTFAEKKVAAGSAGPVSSGIPLSEAASDVGPYYRPPILPNADRLEIYQLLYVLLDEPLIQGYIRAINKHSAILPTKTTFKDMIKSIVLTIYPSGGESQKPILVAKQEATGVGRLNNVLKDTISQIIGEQTQKKANGGGSSVSLTPADYDISQIIDQITTELFEGVGNKINDSVNDKQIQTTVLNVIRDCLDTTDIDKISKTIVDRTYNCLIGSLCVRVRMHIFYKMFYKKQVDESNPAFHESINKNPRKILVYNQALDTVMNPILSQMIPKLPKPLQKGGTVNFKYTTDKPYTISTPVYNLFSERMMGALKDIEFKKNLAMVALDANGMYNYFTKIYIQTMKNVKSDNMSDVFAKYIFVESVSFDWKQFRFVRANSDIMTIMKQLSVVFYGLPFRGKNFTNKSPDVVDAGFRYFFQEYLYYSDFSTRIRENTEFSDLISTLNDEVLISDPAANINIKTRFGIDESLNHNIQNMIYYAQNPRAYKKDTTPHHKPTTKSNKKSDTPTSLTTGGNRRRTKRSTRRRRRRTRKTR